MTTYNEQKQREEQEQFLREALAKELGAELVSSPELNQIIDNIVKSVFEDGADPSTTGSAASGNSGLGQLIGLDGDAPTNLGSVDFAPKIMEYDEEVTRERIMAAADLYYAMQHEILGIFQVVLKLQELFYAGTLQISTGEGAFGLYRFDKQQVLRYKRDDRLQAYKRLFGWGPLPPPKGGRPNPQFQPLFSGFVGQVVAYYQAKRLSDVIQATNATARSGSIASVRRSALDTRNNLKGASYGHITVLRIEVMQLLDEAFRILSAQDILKALGAENGWEVVEEVSRRYFNKPAVNVSQRSRLASAGASLIAALGDSWVTKQARHEFEVGLQSIEVAAEEWYTSAQALGIVQAAAPAPQPKKAAPRIVQGRAQVIRRPAPPKKRPKKQPKDRYYEAEYEAEWEY